MKNFRHLIWSKTIIGMVVFSLVACNSADKRSNMMKDSVNGDTVMPNKVGGSETFQAKLDGEAVDHLRNLTYSLLMEHHLLMLNAGKENKSPETKSLIDINQASQKRIEAYAAGKSVILPSDLLANQQITLDSLKSLKPENIENASITLLKANASFLLKEIKLATNNREQDFIYERGIHLPAEKKQFASIILMFK